MKFYYEKILILLTIGLFFTTNNSFAQEDVDFIIQKCPDEIFIGERQNTNLVVRNSDSHAISIVNLELAVDGLENMSNSSITLPNSELFPLTLDSFESKIIPIVITSNDEGIHYVDTRMIYLLENSENKVIEKNGICQFNAKPLESLWDPIWLTISIGAITSGFGSGAAYTLKRHFLKKDVEHKKTLEHENWLLQQDHSLANKYYFPLAKFALEAKRSISISASSKKLDDIEMAYQKLTIFIDKYMEFKENTGGLFNFKNRMASAMAISKTQAIFVGLPFNESDLYDIRREYQSAKEDKKDLDYISKSYCSFKNWIVSNYCQKSRDHVMKKLFDLQGILDDHSEELVSPNYAASYYPKLTENNSIGGDPFWILRSSTKYVKQGDEVHIFGEGFTNPDISFKFRLGNRDLVSKKTFDNAVIIQIPGDISCGTYDLCAKYTINLVPDETISLVFHVSKIKLF